MGIGLNWLYKGYSLIFSFFLIKIWPYKGNFAYEKNFLAWKFFSMVGFFCKYTRSKAHQKLTIWCWNNFLKKHKEKFFRQKWIFSLWKFVLIREILPMKKIFGLKIFFRGQIFLQVYSFESSSKTNYMMLKQLFEKT